MDDTPISYSASMQMDGASFSGMMGPMLFVNLVFYIFYGYCMYTIAKKIGEQYAWMAWVPILNIFLYFRMAKMSFWWLLGLLVPLLNIYVLIRLIHDGISKRTGHGGWWTVGLIFLGFIMIPVTAFTYQPNQTTPAAPTVQ